MSVENPSALNLDERLNRLVESTRAAAKTAEAAVEAAEANRKAIAEAAEANRKAIVESAEASRKAVVEAAESTRKSIEAAAKTAEAAAEAAAKTAKAAEADRDRFSRLEEKMAEDRRNNEGSRSNISRAMEDTIAASLPRAVKKTHGIVIRPEDVQVRARKDNNSKEYDFIAPNGELVLVGEVKIRLTYEDVEKFIGSLEHTFRDLFPEYAHMPVYGVVAGGAIDEDAAILARKCGFIIMRMEGGKIHPDTGKNYQPKKF